MILTALAALFSYVPAIAQEPASRTVVQNPHGELKDECSSCHSAKGWKPAQVSKDFAHAPKTFPLVGAHATAKCMSCHTSLDFKHASTRCADCHKDVHRGELGADCGRCHTPRNFLDRSVMQKLHQTTRFQLTGAHLMADCQSCHAPLAQGHLSFINVPTECGACHLAAYQATASMGGGVPPHASVGFSTQCEQCHITVSWSNAAYNHAASGFALTGAHVHQPCSACHVTGYTNMASTCISCHQANYASTTAPVHSTVPAFAPTLCTDCHTTSSWQPSLWKHVNTWPNYTGRHVGVPCASCHGTGVYAGTSTTCVSCHAAQQHGEGPNCQNCHTTSGWGGG